MYLPRAYLPYILVLLPLLYVRDSGDDASLPSLWLLLQKPHAEAPAGRDAAALVREQTWETSSYLLYLVLHTSSR